MPVPLIPYAGSDSAVAHWREHLAKKNGLTMAQEMRVISREQQRGKLLPEISTILGMPRERIDALLLEWLERN